MTRDYLARQAEMYLQKLCIEIGDRRTGCEANRQATEFFEAAVKRFGFETESQAFDCIDWRLEGSLAFAVDGERYDAFAGPWSPRCDVTAPLAVVSSVEELEKLDVRGKVLLLRGEITSGQLMPKNFPFYKAEEHQRIYRLLEAKQPAAVIAATGRSPETAGSQYPFPFIDDGDFDIASAYMKDTEGDKLAGHVGRPATLAFQARRIPSTGRNVVARKRGRGQRRIVITAHIDAKAGSPGASDDAGGVAVLLLLAELLQDLDAHVAVELVAMNGEDYYAVPGEQAYAAHNAGRFDEILLGINVDGAGYRIGKTAYSLYECPPELALTARETLAGQPGLIEGPQWYQGDHLLFVLNGRPALAVTSELAGELVAEITHTPRDTPDVLDSGKLADLAVGLAELVRVLDADGSAGPGR